MLAGSILQRLVQSRDKEASGRTPLNFGVYYKNTLVALCHALEDAVLATQTSPLIVTAFQKGKWYLQEAERYKDLAATADKIVIMAVPDSGFRAHETSQQDNVSLVDIDADDPVSEEWHLMIMGSSYSAMVLCQELTEEEYGPGGLPENDLERKFYGFWTFDPKLVSQTISIAANHIGRYDKALKQDLRDRLKRIDAGASSKTGEVGNVVMRVVDYLQGGDRQIKPNESFQFAGALSQNLESNELQAYLRMAQLADLADPSNPLGAAEVASLSELMGQFLDLPVWQMQRLRLASLLHRIAPAQFDPQMVEEEGDHCPLNPGAQTLRILPRLRAVAQIIAHQHEWWNGEGQPAGLKGDGIPVESRVLGLVADFQHEVARLRYEAEGHDGEKGEIKADSQADLQKEIEERAPDAENEWQHVTDAFAACKAQAGDRWDPKLLEVLGFLVSGLQQGLSLPTIPLRMMMSAGLLNSEVADAWPEMTISTSAPSK
ncbi:MAG: metal-dependent phosphohydrolase [Leptolyngbya foveolarum]|uniref:Metal-dependent phosphohydrolase n=1 Tax=Leptolyngbya foveolarum TaxID=47253 RepID=A0A2W4VWS3_9CYAN|nr:MAG: metal-dependent phosphohydrolase [Leptolyngbya foveolarum]